ncbi:hypothetical protein TA3x_002524 [Tundrisphaera sp. TA3]|uniref:hypothetical protein n=1 Tax=Tundrisphaera sp. TA3 TaxID=3435775 RepID=UPI003EC06D65
MSGHTTVDERGEQALKGSIRAVNFAPKGEIDGLILDVAGETVQVNLPPGREEIRQRVGQEVEVIVVPEPKVADHPKGPHRVHKLVAFAGEDREAKPPHPPKPPHPGHGEKVKASGKVSRFNFAKHGEANGVVLEGGEFLHLKPDGMKRAGLELGQHVEAEGEAKPSPTGVRAIETSVVNGVALGPKKGH